MRTLQNVPQLKRQVNQCLDNHEYSQAEALLSPYCHEACEDAELWCLLGIIYLQKNHYVEAEGALKRAVTLNPKVVEVHANLGLLYKAIGDIRASKFHLLEALSINPNFIPARHSLGIIFCTLGELEQGLDCFRQVLSLDAHALSSMKNMGDAYCGLAKYAQSELWYRKALALKPDYLPAELALVRIFKVRNDIEKMRLLMHQLLDKYPCNSEVIGVYGQVCHVLGENDKALALLKSQLDDEDDLFRKRIPMYFKIADILHKKEEYAEAFEYYARANQPRSKYYDKASIETAVKKNIDFFTPEYLKKHCFKKALKGKKAGADLIFVVGMSRSGTSLMEQILDSHPEVKGAGELMAINTLIQELNTQGLVYPESLTALTRQEKTMLRQKYREAVLKALSLSESTYQGRLVDKMPFNYLNIGLILFLFPSARIIHCRRHPMDTGVSNYIQSFGCDIPFSYSLAHIGHYYSHYHAMMAYWQKVLGDRLLTVQYEDLVGNLEDEVRKILRYCHLTWSEQCLSFHENKRLIATASIEQVKRPIYRSSVGRWKSYAAQLKPLQEALNAGGVPI